MKEIEQLTNEATRLYYAYCKPQYTRVGFEIKCEYIWSSPEAKEMYDYIVTELHQIQMSLIAARVDEAKRRLNP